MERGPAIARSPMPVMKEPERIGDEFERRRADTLGLSVDIETAARPMFFSKGRKPFLQKVAVEIRMMGYDQHHPAQQIIDGTVIDAVPGDHLIGDAGNPGDLRREGSAGIFEPFPRAENFVDPPGLTLIFEEADAEFADLVAIGIGGGGFHIHDSGDELWAVIRPVPPADS